MDVSKRFNFSKKKFTMNTLSFFIELKKSRKKKKLVHTDFVK